MTDSEWIDGDRAHVFWREHTPDMSLLPLGECMIRVSNGVLEVQEKNTDAFHYFASDTWLRIRVTGTGRAGVND